MTKVFAVAALQRYAIEFDDVLVLLICAISNINVIESTTIFLQDVLLDKLALSQFLNFTCAGMLTFSLFIF